MKRVGQMDVEELRHELAQARLVCVAFDATESADAFENVGHYATARTALEHWKQAARYRKRDE